MIPVSWRVLRLLEGLVYVSRNSSNLCDKVSPVTSTTRGISCRGPAERRTVPRAPTTSSSGKPSISLFAPALSDGGPRGREGERFCGRLPAWDAVEAGVAVSRPKLSEPMTASTREDMLGDFWEGGYGEAQVGEEWSGGADGGRVFSQKRGPAEVRRRRAARRVAFFRVSPRQLNLLSALGLASPANLPRHPSSWTPDSTHPRFLLSGPGKPWSTFIS